LCRLGGGVAWQNAHVGLGLRRAAGALAFVIAITALVAAGASGRPPRPAATTAAAAPSYEILPQSSCPSGEVAIGRACVQPSGYGDEWSQSDGSATWTHSKMNPQWTVTGTWTVPDTIPAAGGDVMMTISGTEMTHDPGASICPAIGAGGDFTIVGGPNLGGCAQNDANGQGNPMTISKSLTVKVIPPSGAQFANLEVGVQDGPHFLALLSVWG
jgi:hypothetical protein